jgi:hypothetical protein
MPQTMLVEQMAADLAPQARAGFLRQYRRLLDLGSSPLDLSDFLHEFLRGTAELYAASAAAIWFRNPRDGSLERKVTVGFEALGLDGELVAAHAGLLDHALGQPTPLLVKPFSSAGHGAAASNPTDSFLLLGSLGDGAQSLGVLELFLGPVPVRGQTDRVQAAYVEWLEHLSGLLREGIERRFLASECPLTLALADLERASRCVQAYQQQIRNSLESSLQALAGRNFGALQANQAVARRVHELLESMGLRVQCPECGAPSILRCQRAGNAKTGVFLFDHYLESGRTFHGGPTTFPAVRVVPKTPRRARQQAVR